MTLWTACSGGWPHPQRVTNLPRAHFWQKGLCLRPLAALCPALTVPHSLSQQSAHASNFLVSEAPDACNRFDIAADTCTPSSYALPHPSRAFDTRLPVVLLRVMPSSLALPSGVDVLSSSSIDALPFAC